MSDFRDTESSEGERLANLAMWVKSLPSDVEGEAGMVKLIRHMLADIDEIVKRMSEGSES